MGDSGAVGPFSTEPDINNQKMNRVVFSKRVQVKQIPQNDSSKLVIEL